MRNETDQARDRYATRLRELPFIRDVRIVLRADRASGQGDEAAAVLRAPDGKHNFLIETKRTHLTYAVVEHLLALRREVTRDGLQTRQRVRANGRHQPWILFAPYVPRKMGHYLATRGVNYIDLEGNCHLRLGDRYIATIEGRIPERREAEGRGLRAAGYQVLFAILARPELLNEGIVKIAELAGVGKTTVAATLEKLEHEGLVMTLGKRRRLVKAGVVLDRWLVGYLNAVRPRLLIGRYRTQDENPERLERRIEQALGNEREWAWGGGAAAMRLTQHYRGETTVLHVAGPEADLPKRLHALRDANGPLVLLTVPGRLAFEGAVPRTVHPLLVYTELLTSGDERARETAFEIRQQHLGDLAW